MAESQIQEVDLDESEGYGFSDLRNKKLKARMATDRYASEYNMKHKNRGQAHIFNHYIFDDPDKKPRTGTHKDSESLYDSLTNLHFDVHIHNDKNIHEIHKIVKEAALEDHTDSDCIVIAILSHGQFGYIDAKDYPYKLDSISNYFTADNCKTLAGKPKLFFIQACQGKSFDSGITLKKTEMDGISDFPKSYKIPLHADFLIAFSTIPGYFSWRNEDKGSWYIQSLCSELDMYGKHYDILTLLTFVSQHVAIDFESNTRDKSMQNKKQIPCITSMLTRILRFADKE